MSIVAKSVWGNGPYSAINVFEIHFATSGIEMIPGKKSPEAQTDNVGPVSQTGLANIRVQVTILSIVSLSKPALY